MSKRKLSLHPLDDTTAVLKRVRTSKHVKLVMANRNRPMGPPVRRFVDEVSALSALSYPCPGTTNLSLGSLAAACSAVPVAGALSTVPMLLQMMGVVERDSEDPGSTQRYGLWLTDGATKVPARLCSTQHHRLIPDGEGSSFGLAWVTKFSILRLGDESSDMCQLLVLEARPPVGYPALDRLVGDPDPPVVTCPPPAAPTPPPSPGQPADGDPPGVCRSGDFFCDGRHCQKAYCKAGENQGEWVDSAIPGVGCSLRLSPLPAAQALGVWDVCQGMHFDGHEAPDNPSEGTHRQHRWVSYHQAATTRWHDVRGRNCRVQMPHSLPRMRGQAEAPRPGRAVHRGHRQEGAPRLPTSAVNGEFVSCCRLHLARCRRSGPS